MPVPPVPPLDETIVAGQSGHISDHQVIHDALNDFTLSIAAGVALAGAQTITGAKTFNAGTFLDKGGEVANIVAHGADPTGAADSTAAILAAVAANHNVFVPQGKFLCSVTLTAIDDLIIFGPGTLHNTTAGQDALTLIDCDDAHIDLRVQGTAGTRDGIHLENCPRAYLGPNVKCRGTGNIGIYAERCFGIRLDHCTVSVNSPGPYPTGVANCVNGVKLTWDGADVTSGCNGFTIVGGEYVVGRSQQEAIWLERCEGGVITGDPIVSQSGGGIYTLNCENLTIDGGYGEQNPQDVEYRTGTVTVTNGSATVTGSGTTFADGGVGGVWAGQYLRVGGVFQKILTRDSNTQLTLAAVWGGTTQAGATYAINSASLVLDGTTHSNVVRFRCGDAIILDGDRNKLGFPQCETVWVGAGITHNTGDVVTNRGSSASATGLTDPANRIQNWGNGTNQFRQIDRVTGAEVPQWHIIGGTGEPAFENSWANVGGSQYTAAFMRLPNGMVILRGQIQSGTVGTAVFTLPTGYRPTALHGPVPVHANGAFARLQISSAGVVVALTTNVAYNLDGVCFVAG